MAQKVLHELAQPMQIKGQDVFCPPASGSVSSPPTRTSADDLIRNADTAMYSAKRLGRNSYQFFTAELNVQMHERLVIEHGLRRAEQRNELRLLYQPKIDLGQPHDYRP